MQPFGGHGLSGTGPKAGGPLYLKRLLAVSPPVPPALRPAPEKRSPAAQAFADWLASRGLTAEAARCRSYIEHSPTGTVLTLPGPVGERNLYRIHPRGTVLCLPQTETGLLLQIGAALATGNKALIPATSPLPDLPKPLQTHITPTPDWTTAPDFQAVLFEGDSDALRDLNRQLATRPGPIVAAQGINRDALASGAQDYALVPLVEEQSVSTDTAAAGGNASLMSIG